MVDLTVDLGFLTIKNPVITASGTFGYGEEFLPFFDLNQLGGFVLKGIYKNPRKGNPAPRLCETPSGLLNSIGLAGPGAQELKATILNLAARTDAPIIVNVCGETDDEYQEVSEIFDRMAEVSILELNISCPNVHKGGQCPAQSTEHTYQLVKRIKSHTQKPLMIKLSPNVPDISAVAVAAEKAGADAISLVNTFLGMAVDLENRAPLFKNTVAGLSGPAIKPMALKLVWETAGAVSIPVIGMGGITSGKDVLDYILVGAAAVQIGTINMVEPGAAVRIIKETGTLMEKLGIRNLEEIRGKLKTGTQD